jgi:hypothetical protein
MNRFKKLAAQAGVPVVTLHEGGRHTGNSLMRDAGVDQELRMREVGHADRSVTEHYTHPLGQALLAASEQTAALVRKAGAASWPGRVFPFCSHSGAEQRSQSPPERLCRRSSVVAQAELEPRTGGSTVRWFSSVSASSAGSFP